MEVKIKLDGMNSGMIVKIILSVFFDDSIFEN
jgi:hypothetical protein